MECGPPGSSVHGILQIRRLPFPSVMGLGGSKRTLSCSEDPQGPQFLVRTQRIKLPPIFFIHVGLSTGQVTKHSSVLHESWQGRESPTKTDMILCNIITEMTSYHFVFCWLRASHWSCHTQGEGINYTRA